MSEPRPAVIVHGGAGHLEEARQPAALAACHAAASAALAVLAAAGAALDAAQAAVRVLEDEPVLNAGIGAVLSRDGTVELDASIMCGTTLGAGAIAAVPNLRRPIDLARAVLDDGEQVLLCGEGALRFAREHGVRPCAAETLITQRARERLRSERARRRGIRGAVIDAPGGTVGAVVVDGGGHVAAATSTGGLNGKRTGRIGDTPLVGCGTYADDRAGAAAATGDGEAIIRVTLTRQCIDRMAAGAGAQESARAAIADLVARTGGSAGIICCDASGRLGAAHASPTMVMAAGMLAPGPRVLSRVMTAADADLTAELQR